MDYFPWGTLNGLDKTGHVVEWVGLGDTDTKGLLLSSSQEELIRYKVRRDRAVLARTRAWLRTYERAGS